MSTLSDHSVPFPAFKNKNEKNMIIQKAILNTVIVGASVFCISSVLSAALIAITSNMTDPILDPDTVSTYAVIPGEIYLKYISFLFAYL